jgi:hypothetical protein
VLLILVTSSVVMTEAYRLRLPLSHQSLPKRLPRRLPITYRSAGRPDTSVLNDGIRAWHNCPMRTCLSARDPRVIRLGVNAFLGDPGSRWIGRQAADR